MSAIKLWEPSRWFDLVKLEYNPINNLVPIVQAIIPKDSFSLHLWRLIDANPKRLSGGYWSNQVPSGEGLLDSGYYPTCLEARTASSEFKYSKYVMNVVPDLDPLPRIPVLIVRFLLAPPPIKR